MSSKTAFTAGSFPTSSSLQSRTVAIAASALFDMGRACVTNTGQSTGWSDHKGPVKSPPLNGVI